MRYGGWMVGCLAGGWCLVSISGCASLDKYQRLQAAHRSIQADKQALAQELFDARSVNDSIRARVVSLERELETKNELLANLREENELLDDMFKTARVALEEMGGKQTLGDISIRGPALPQPLDSALKRFADEHPTAVAYDPSRGTIKWKADLLFALGSDVVKQASMESLRGFSDIIKSPIAADFEVIVVGHTDNRPIVKSRSKHPTNWHLSAHRAISVSTILLKSGYAAGRIGVMGYGEHRPVADNATEAGSSQNRRVEVYLVPKGTIVPAVATSGRLPHGEALAFVPLSR